MKTKKIIAAMVQCISNRTCLGCIYENDDNCRNAILEEAKNRLMDYVAEIDGLKKNVEKLKKDLAERGAARGWISVEDRLPEIGKNVLIKYENDFTVGYLQMNNTWVLYYGNGWITSADTSSSPTHWMPIPKPLEPPKKVKTYRDVFLEAFPKARMKDDRPENCRNAILGIYENCKFNCYDCWNQPYPEEEGEAE